MKTVYCQMANTPLNYIVPYFIKFSPQNPINNLQNLIIKKFFWTKRRLILQIVPQNYFKLQNIKTVKIKQWCKL